MDRRVLLTVLMSVGIILVWQHFFMPPPPPPQAGAPSAPVQPGAPSAPKAQPGATPAAEAPTEPAAPAEPRPEAVIDRVERKGLYRATFTSWGGAPSEWVLLHPQYQAQAVVDGKKVLRPIDLVKRKEAPLPLSIAFPQSDFVVPADAAFTKEAGGADELVYAWQNERVRVEKRFSFVPGTYEVRLKVSVENKTDKPLAEHLEVGVYGWQDPSQKPGGLLSAHVIQTEGMCHVDGKLRHADLDGLLKESVEQVGAVGFIGIDEKYFLAAVAVRPDAGPYKCVVGAQPSGAISATVLAGERRVDPGQKVEHELTGFFGPKVLSQLDAVTVGGTDVRLGDAVNYGWTEAIARPMLAVLKAVHRVVPNWGLAVIVLTILLKMATWWPTQKSMKSMKAMAMLKPEMDKLKAKYGDDKQRINAEVMGLYKQHGINPLGGCLPMLIQMPIYIALYSMLGNSVELYRSGFVGWIHDLTSPDPFFVLPAATGVLMFAQQRFSPTPPDPQQKAMMYMMPLMFTAFSVFLPAGLTVYILTNTLLTIVQQWWMNRGDKAKGRPQPRPAKA